MESSAFKTDFYELTMAQAIFYSELANRKAVFETFARKLPKGRRYGIVGGTNRLLKEIQNFKFTKKQINYLQKHKRQDGKLTFNKEFLEYLLNYKFEGEIIGYREGDLYFPYSPIFTVKGTFIETVLLETIILSILNHDSAVASAATRMVEAARGKPLIEMGSRRTDDDAAIHSARIAYITGFDSTSNVEAGYRYGIKVGGTSAHAFTLAFPTELDAFNSQIKTMGEKTTLLVDTYDIPQGISNAINAGGKNLGAIRIDSGDLQIETINARKQLDTAGNFNTKILLSSDIDEFVIDELLDRNIPVDIIGAGTRVVTGSGHPTASMVYKLVEIEDNNKMQKVAKKSESKKSIGGEKTVYRKYENGKFSKELLFIDIDQNLTGLEPVQHQLVKNNVYNIETIEESRKFHKEVMKKLPIEALRINAGKPFIEAEVTN